MARTRKHPIMHLDGHEELNRALRAIGDRASGIVLQRAAEEGAKEIQKEAERNAPRESGQLEENIVARVIPRGQKVGRARADVGPTKRAFYAAFVERGTSRMPAQPWLRPAFEASISNATEAVGRALRKWLRLS
jgi:HK97 gp10 family phage protein